MKKILLFIVLFASCQKKEFKTPPSEKITFFANSVNLIPKDKNTNFVWVQLNQLDSEIAIGDNKKTKTFDLKQFLAQAKMYHFFSKPNLPKAFILFSAINEKGIEIEQGVVVSIDNFLYDAAQNKINFEGQLMQELPINFMAKPAKLLNFTLFFEKDSEVILTESSKRELSFLPQDSYLK